MKRLLFFVTLFTLFFVWFSQANYISPTLVSTISNNDYRPIVWFPEWNAISWDYLYVWLNIADAVTIWDISDPDAIQEIGVAYNVPNPKWIALWWNYAYISSLPTNNANQKWISIIDISNPDNPILVGNSFVVCDDTSSSPIYIPAASWNYVYAGACNAFYVIDVSDPHNPNVVWSLVNSGTYARLSVPYKVVVSGAYAYVTSYSSNALQIIDISNPSTPTPVGSIQHTTTLRGASDFILSGNFVYIISRWTATTSGVISVVNVSNPSSPTIAGSLASFKFKWYEIWLKWNYAYISSYTNNSLEVIDVSNSSVPVHVASLDDGQSGAVLDRTRGISIKDNRAYISVSASNVLQIVDISNPINPTPFRTIEPPIYLWHPRTIRIYQNKWAYILSVNSNALQVIDVSNPQNPTPSWSLVLRKNWPQFHSPQWIDFRWQYAYVVSAWVNAWLGTLTVLDVSNPSNPNYVNAIITWIYNGWARDIKIVGDYWYVPMYIRDGIQIIDIASNPTSPIALWFLWHLSSGALLDWPRGIDVLGNYVYVASYLSNALQIIDISDPNNPIPVASLSDGTSWAKLNRPIRVQVVNNIAYIISQNSNALQIVDVSYPSNPTPMWSISNWDNWIPLERPYDLKIVDNRAYIGAQNSNTFTIVDVSDPYNPNYLYSLTNGAGGAKLVWAAGVAVNDDYAYVLGWWNESNALNIIKIKNIASNTVPWWSATIIKDNCPDGDFSPSYYDGSCGTAPIKHNDKKIQVCTWYSEELNHAYIFAFAHNITTLADCQKAQLDWPLIRSHMAKMISNFSISILKKTPDTDKICNFADIGSQSQEMKYYTQLACQLWLMGLESDGITHMNNFMPNDVVTRAQFGTILSRLLRGTQYAWGIPYYEKHFQALKNAGIMTKIEHPSMPELRWRVMLMMMRIFEWQK